jgi:hypothetical protein
MKRFGQIYPKKHVFSEPFPDPQNDKCFYDEDGICRLTSCDSDVDPWECIPYPINLNRCVDCYVVLLFRESCGDPVDYVVDAAMLFSGKDSNAAVHVEMVLFCGGDLSQANSEVSHVVSYGCYMTESYGVHIHSLKDIYLGHRAFAMKISKNELLYLYMLNTFMVNTAIPYNTQGLFYCTMNKNSKMISDRRSIFEISKTMGIFCSQSVVLFLREALEDRTFHLSTLNSRCVSPSDIMKELQTNADKWREVSIRSIFSEALVFVD